MRNIFKKIVAFVLIGVLAVAFAGNMQASADDGGKAYKYK